jgi:acyl-coenzyme A synthetase/AMP-(fatty) acid ligase
MPIHITQMFDEDPHRLPTAKQLSKVRIITSSGGKITSHMRTDIDAYFPDAEFFSMHGLSEAFRSAFLDPKQIKIRPDSIGKAIPDVDLYVINEDGEDCKPREIGELIHRGACIYKGYWNSKEDTDMRFKSIKILEKVINLEGDLTDEIVVASGDFVYRDEEGYLYFVSRQDDMIKTSGYRVSPIEIESVVQENIPQIISCAVFSIENEKIEEEIVLVYSSESEISKNEIIFELKKHLANYMIPSLIVYKKSIPLYYGEIDKKSLKREIIERV